MSGNQNEKDPADKQLKQKLLDVYNETRGVMKVASCKLFEAYVDYCLKRPKGQEKEKVYLRLL